MSNLLKRPKDKPTADNKGRYERFYLTENPFPTEPVNKDSTDQRINGDIYESEIRTKELASITEAFIKKPQSDRNRLRLGYICDTSYIGRGNGKSAFLVNLAQLINKNYCLDISDEVNKCFAVYVVPEPGGRTKTFPSFVDLIFESIMNSGIIDISLASLRLSAATTLYSEKNFSDLVQDEDELVNKLNSEDWFKEVGVEHASLVQEILKNPYLQSVPSDFPLMKGRNSLFKPFVAAKDFSNYYFEIARKGRPRLEFVFSHLVQMFFAAGFNGAYILVDDFERIPDFQSSRQRKDFAIELRTILLDGPYKSAHTGFYNMLLTLHAGVPQLISEAWGLSGLGNRYPIAPKVESDHWIAFEKLSNKHVSLLLKKYLAAYRVSQKNGNDLTPFTNGAVSLIAEINENNAAKILSTCWNLLERAAENPEQNIIDKRFVREKTEQVYEGSEQEPTIEDPTATDLMKKAMGGKD